MHSRRVAFSGCPATSLDIEAARGAAARRATGCRRRPISPRIHGRTAMDELKLAPHGPRRDLARSPEQPPIVKPAKKDLQETLAIADSPLFSASRVHAPQSPYKQRRVA